MLLIEIKDGLLYMTTDDREEILTLIPYLIKSYEELRDRGKNQTTRYEGVKVKKYELPKPA